MQCNIMKLHMRLDMKLVFIYDIICGLDIFLVRLDMRLDILPFFYTH